MVGGKIAPLALPGRNSAPPASVRGREKDFSATPRPEFCGSRGVFFPHFRVPPSSYHPMDFGKFNPTPGKNLSVPLMPASALLFPCFAEAILHRPPPALTATLDRISFSSLFQLFVALKNAP